MSKKTIGFISMILCMSMIIAVFVGCKGKVPDTSGSVVQESVDTTTEVKDLPLLTYTCFLGTTNTVKTAMDNPNDVITPYLEDRFKIKVEIIQPEIDILPKERLNLLMAIDEVPDVVLADGGFASYAIETGEFLDDLGSYVDNMVNYGKYFDERLWKNFKSNGKIYSIPSLTQSEKIDNLMVNEPYYPLFDAWAYWVREDILAMAGYTFTPMKDLEKNITSQGKDLTLEDLKIEPAIDTPEKWIEMLQKIKALNLKVGDQDVIPMSIASWNQFHIGNMAGLSQFKIASDGNVSGFLGCPEAKDWYKTLWGLYNDGILDKTFMLQKNDMLQSKISSGLVASGMYIPDCNAAIENIKKLSPEADIRYIPWPKKTVGVGSFDVKMGGMYRMVINKNFEDVGRLTQYWDWFYSDEAFDIMAWGPESAGLYEVKDGVKMFKDPELANAIKNNGPAVGTKGPEYYGLYVSYPIDGGFASVLNKAEAGAPISNFGNVADQRKSYSVPLNIYTVTKGLCGAGGVNTDGTAAYDDGGSNTSAVGTYYWGTFQADRAGKIFAAKDEDAFNKAWDEQYKIFVDTTNYDAAIADMTKFFENK